VSLTNSTVALNALQGGAGGMGGTEGFRTGFGNGGSGGAGGSSQGGGLYLASGTVQLTNDTVARNLATDSVGGSGAINGMNGAGAKGTGGGVNNPGATVNALNTIFGANQASQAPDFSGNFATASRNLLENNAGSNLSGGNGNLVGTPQNPIDPKLGPLAQNGGPTRTMALLATSPAIDAGTPTGAPRFDQRGVLRGSPPDIGAFENNQASDVAFPAPGDTAPVGGSPADFGQTRRDTDSQAFSAPVLVPAATAASPPILPGEAAFLPPVRLVHSRFARLGQQAEKRGLLDETRRAPADPSM
jgi:hypothetical protein